MERGRVGSCSQADLSPFLVGWRGNFESSRVSLPSFQLPAAVAGFGRLKVGWPCLDSERNLFFLLLSGGYRPSKDHSRSLLKPEPTCTSELPWPRPRED